MVPFSELFQQVDTIRVDASVLIGEYTFIDVDEAGNLLITDEVSRITHLFSATGRHMKSYSVPDCVPTKRIFFLRVRAFTVAGVSWCFPVAREVQYLTGVAIAWLEPGCGICTQNPFVHRKTQFSCIKILLKQRQ